MVFVRSIFAKVVVVVNSIHPWKIPTKFIGVSGFSYSTQIKDSSRSNRKGQLLKLFRSLSSCFPPEENVFIALLPASQDLLLIFLNEN